MILGVGDAYLYVRGGSIRRKVHFSLLLLSEVSGILVAGLVQLREQLGLRQVPVLRSDPVHHLRVRDDSRRRAKTHSLLV